MRTRDEIMAMDAERLRIEIALARGYIDGEHEFYYPLGGDNQYFCTDGRFNCDTPLPNWPVIIADAWELLEEMRPIFMTTAIYGDVNGWRVEIDDGARTYTTNPEPAPFAISRAWYIWFNEKTETK